MTETTNPLTRYLLPLRRWWSVIVGAAALGAVIGWVLMPEPPPDVAEQVQAEPGVEFRATHILIRGEPTATTASFDLVQLLARQGEVSLMVEDRVGDVVEPGTIDTVELITDDSLGTLSITAVQPLPEQAVALSDAWAESLTAFFDVRARESREQQIERANERLVQIDTRVRELEAGLAALGVDTEEGEAPQGAEALLLQAELDALLEQYGRLRAEIRDVAAANATSRSTFETLQEPVAVSSEATDTTAIPFEVPENSPLRIVLGLLLGALLGIAVVIGLDRIDTRVRTRTDAELAFGLPVIAEVPRRSRRQRDRTPLPVVADPGSDVAEAFRALRLAVQFTPRWQLRRQAPTADGDTVGAAAPVRGGETPTTLLVTSAITGEGKSTIAANLAASIAESGQHVLVVDCDFRRSSVHQLLDVNAATGLRDYDPHRDDLGDLVVSTAVPRVSLLPVGTPGYAPAWFLAEGQSLVDAARELADVVIFDAGPMLATNEATALATAIDALLVVARSGKTSTVQARLTMEQLTRLNAMVAGVVLIGGEGTRTYGYYEPIRRAAAAQQTSSR